MLVWGDTLTTVAQADAYATARGWADWLALTAVRKGAAILDASTFVRVSYLPPATQSMAGDTAIADAVAEAARLSLSAPLLGGEAAGKPAKRRVKAGSVEVEYAEASDLRRDRLALVDALLLAAGARPAGGLNVRLVRA